jgi:hypothetical protein
MALANPGDMPESAAASPPQVFGIALHDAEHAHSFERIPAAEDVG